MQLNVLNFVLCIRDPGKCNKLFSLRKIKPNLIYGKRNKLCKIKLEYLINPKLKGIYLSTVNR